MITNGVLSALIREDIEHINIVQPKAEILKFTSPTGADCILNIEKIARVCYKSEDKITGNVDDAINFLKRTIFRNKENPHESVIEHEGATVRFTCDRGVSHEIVRHRIASFSQESTRYCNYSKDKYDNKLHIIDPTDAFGWDYNTPEGAKKIIAWGRSMESAAKSYLDMIEMGCAPQEARDVLPNSLKTEIVVTMNMRGWRHFFKLRDDNAAHPQMRQLAGPLHEEFKKQIPFLFDDI